MLHKYKHVSFDLDGTLVHTLPGYRHAIVPQVVQTLGGTISSPHATDRFWFEGGRNAIIEKEFGLKPEIFWELFERDTKKTPAMAGVFFVSRIRT